MIVYMEFNARVLQALGEIPDPVGLAGINKNKFCDLLKRDLLLAFEIEKIMA